MNEVERLFKNIKVFIKCGEFENEADVFATENPDLDSIHELNEIMETEIYYMAENAE